MVVFDLNRIRGTVAILRPFLTSFTLGTVTSQEVGFIRPTLAQIVALTLGYLKGLVELSVKTMPEA